MKTFGIFVIAVIGSSLAFPWPWNKRQTQENQVQDPNTGSNWPTMDFSFSLKFSHLIKFYTHITKSYVDADILITYYQLPAAERQCIEDFMDSYKNQSMGAWNITEDEYLAELKAACPNSAAVIQTLYEKAKAMMQRYMQQYMNFVNGMPASIKTAEQKLRDALTILGQNNQFKDPVALKTILVPALQAFQQIPQADVQTVATNYPFLAPILTGAQNQVIPTLLQSTIDYINTGNCTNPEGVKQAMKDLGIYLKNLLQQLLYNIDHAQEATLPADADQALRQKIGNDLAKSFQQLTKIPFIKVNVDQVNDVYEITV